MAIGYYKYFFLIEIIWPLQEFVRLWFKDHRNPYEDEASPLKKSYKIKFSALLSIL